MQTQPPISILAVFTTADATVDAQQLSVWMVQDMAAPGDVMGKSPATLDWSADVSNPPTIGTSTLDSAGAQAAAAAAITAAGVSTFDPASDVVAHVSLVDTTTTNADMVAAAPDAATIASNLLGSDTSGYDPGSVGAALEATGSLGDPWAAPVRTLTSTAASVMAAVTGSSLAITGSAGFSATLTGLTIPATWTAIVFSLKTNLDHTDARSIVQIRESNPGVGSDGLQYLNGAVATAAQGSLTVNQSAGTVAIALTAAATVQLVAQSGLVYDLKLFRSDGEPSVLTAATASINLTPTKAII